MINESGQTVQPPVGDVTPLRVLLIDDNPFDRALLSRELRQEFADVQQHDVTNLDELDAALQDRDYDLVITDFHLLWTDGLKVLERVKQQDPLCPVIMFTGTGSEEVAVEAMKKGLDDYVIKSPQHVVRIRAAVRNVLRQAATRRTKVDLENRLAYLLSRLDVGVFRCDLDGNILDVNDTFAEIFQMESDRLLGRNLDEVFSNDPMFHESLAKLEDQHSATEVDVRLMNSEGDVRWIRIYMARGHVCQCHRCVDGLARDITAQKRSDAEARLRASASSRLAQLSKREQQVADLVVSGSSTKQIAEELDISVKTVEMHRGNILRKLRVRNAAELVRVFMQAGEWKADLAAVEQWEATH